MRLQGVEPCECGESALEIQECMFDKEMMSIVSCRTCRRSGPPRDSREAAVKGWNKRRRYKQHEASKLKQEKQYVN